MSNQSFTYYYDQHKERSTFKLVDSKQEKLQAHEIRVSVKASGLNPVDYKVASGINEKNQNERVLGFDASGTVLEAGEDVKNFKEGDEVFYAGTLKQSGSFATEQIVDSRIVGKRSSKLDHIESAALPLTSITAWEGLFEVLNVDKEDSEKSILIIGGAGGVGSMVIQLAKAMTNLNVIATGSRSESNEWARSLGADHVINYKNGIKEELGTIGIGEVDYIFCTQNTEFYFDSFVDIVKPFGKIVSIVEVSKDMNLNSLKNKSISFGWEFMFAKSMYNAKNIETQGQILNSISRLLDQGKIKSTMSRCLGTMSVESLEEGFKLLKNGNTIGKLVLKGMNYEN